MPSSRTRLPALVRGHELFLLTGAAGQGVLPRVQFDRVRSQLLCQFDLPQIGIEKQADRHSCLAQPLDRPPHGDLVGDNVEPALGGHFLPPLRNHRGLVGLQLTGDEHDLFRDGKLQVQFDGHRFLEQADVAVLDVAAVLAKVDGDRVGPAKLGQDCRGYRVGLVRLACLSQGGDVVDIHT
jgi:hypothetical protein